LRSLALDDLGSLVQREGSVFADAAAADVGVDLELQQVGK
jgi:hypothetical protein